MTYSFHIVNSSINLYNQLKIKNIKGKERESLIEKTFNIFIEYTIMIFQILII
jgi:hypothetical protein